MRYGSTWRIKANEGETFLYMDNDDQINFPPPYKITLYTDAGGNFTDVVNMTQESPTRWKAIVILRPEVRQLGGMVTAEIDTVAGGLANGQTSSTIIIPAIMSAADFNAAVAANVAASLNAHVVPLQNQITALQAQLAAAGSGNLQPLIDAGLILQPQRRVGTYTIRDFTVLNAIYQAGAPTFFVKRDLDFINIQLLSIRQAVQKMDEVALARAQDPNLTAIYRTRADKRKEYSARINADFVEYLQETTRIMRYAVDEVRYNQKFNLLSPTLVRDLDILP
jgi:hypothetical protein